MIGPMDTREFAAALGSRPRRWKLVWDTLNQEKQWELYNLEADRTEPLDLAKEKPEVIEALSAAYEKWAKRLRRNHPGSKRKNEAG
jgi:hypothetical protein